jgi:hypothetical protein
VQTFWSAEHFGAEKMASNSIARLQDTSRITGSGLKIFALGFFVLAACDNRPDQWDAYIYTGNDLLTHETIRGFKTFEFCQRAAIDRLHSVRPDGGGDYECGYKCVPSAYGGNICAETRK